MRRFARGHIFAGIVSAHLSHPQRNDQQDEHHGEAQHHLATRLGFFGYQVNHSFDHL
jgi:hypothetical protein